MSKTFNLGKIAPLWRGTWSSSTTNYAILDIVYYNGSSFIAVATPQDSAPPTINTTAWKLLAKGATWSELTDDEKDEAVEMVLTAISDQGQLEIDSINTSELYIGDTNIGTTLADHEERIELLEMGGGGGGGGSLPTKDLRWLQNAEAKITFDDTTKDLSLVANSVNTDALEALEGNFTEIESTDITAEYVETDDLMCNGSLVVGTHNVGNELSTLNAKLVKCSQAQYDLWESQSKIDVNKIYFIIEDSSSTTSANTLDETPDSGFSFGNLTDADYEEVDYSEPNIYEPDEDLIDEMPITEINTEEL